VGRAPSLPAVSRPCLCLEYGGGGSPLRSAISTSQIGDSRRHGHGRAQLLMVFPHGHVDRYPIGIDRSCSQRSDRGDQKGRKEPFKTNAQSEARNVIQETRKAKEAKQAFQDNARIDSSLYVSHQLIRCSWPRCDCRRRRFQWSLRHHLFIGEADDRECLV